jgi:hypothetical protein
MQDRRFREDLLRIHPQISQRGPEGPQPNMGNDTSRQLSLRGVRRRGNLDESSGFSSTRLPRFARNDNMLHIGSRYRNIFAKTMILHLCYADSADSSNSGLSAICYLLFAIFDSSVLRSFDFVSLVSLVVNIPDSGFLVVNRQFSFSG